MPLSQRTFRTKELKSQSNPVVCAEYSQKLQITSYKSLPEKFTLEDIRPFLTPEKIASIKKIHALWLSGIPLHLYGSFVTQCGMVLVGKKPTTARDIDAASSLIPLQNISTVFTKLTSQGFKLKNLEETPPAFYKPTFYGFECNKDNVNLDFTVRLPQYVEGPNALPLSAFTMEFVKENSPGIHFRFGKNKFQLEYYCNQSRYQIVTPHIDERGVMRRVLKQIKHNHELYKNHDLHIYFKHQKIENFTTDDKGWRLFTDLMKNDFKNKISTRKFMSYYNEMRRMIREKTFFMPEASLLIKNFCATIIENYYETQHFIKKDAEQEAKTMTLILQKYFSTRVNHPDNFYDIVMHLLSYVSHLKSNDPRMVDILLHTMNDKKIHSAHQNSHSIYKKHSYTPKLFAPQTATSRTTWEPVCRRHAK